eukprot:m51a1_g3459 putative domain containing protein (985) ;mRNA; f:691304-695374
MSEAAAVGGCAAAAEAEASDDQVWAALREELSTRERALVVEYTSRSPEFHTLCAEIALFRKAVLEEMSEEGRFELERREAASLLTNLTRALASNWEPADPSHRAQLRPFMQSLLELFLSGEEPKRDPDAPLLLDLGGADSAPPPPRKIHHINRPLPSPMSRVMSVPARNLSSPPSATSFAPVAPGSGSGSPRISIEGPKASKMPQTPTGAPAASPVPSQSPPPPPVPRPASVKLASGPPPPRPAPRPASQTLAPPQSSPASKAPLSPDMSPRSRTMPDAAPLDEEPEYPAFDARKRFATIGGGGQKKISPLTAEMLRPLTATLMKGAKPPLKSLGNAVPVFPVAMPTVVDDRPSCEEKDKEKERKKSDEGSIMRKLGFGKKSNSRDRLPIPNFDQAVSELQESQQQHADPDQQRVRGFTVASKAEMDKRKDKEDVRQERAMSLKRSDAAHLELLAAAAAASDSQSENTPPREHTVTLQQPTKLQPSLQLEGVSRREHIEHEILVTEQSYVEGLRIALEIYEAPLRQQEPPIVIKEEIDTMFGNLKLLYKFHVELLKNLTAKVDPVGKIFVRVTPFFKNYADYGKTFDEASGILQRLKKENALFRQFLEKQGKLHSEVVTLDHLSSLLITPIQRIPRYNLLLMDLLKNTEETNPDYANIKKSLDLMKSVADVVNSSVKYGENINNLLRIQQSLTFPKEINPRYHQDFIQPHRQFIKEGEMVGILRGNKKCHIMLFLFNDCLIVAKKKRRGTVLMFKMQVSLETVFVEESKMTEGDLCSFAIQTPGRKILLFCTKEERTEWFQTITRYRDDQMEREGQKIVLRLLHKTPSASNSSSMHAGALGDQLSPSHRDSVSPSPPPQHMLERRSLSPQLHCDDDTSTEDGVERTDGTMTPPPDHVDAQKESVEELQLKQTEVDSSAAEAGDRSSTSSTPRGEDASKGAAEEASPDAASAPAAAGASETPKSPLESAKEGSGQPKAESSKATS